MDRAIFTMNDSTEPAATLIPYDPIGHSRRKTSAKFLKLFFVGVVLALILVSFICQTQTNARLEKMIVDSGRNATESLRRNVRLLDRIIERNQRFYRVRKIGGLIYHFSGAVSSHFGKDFAQAKSFCESMDQHLVEFRFDANTTSEVISERERERLRENDARKFRKLYNFILSFFRDRFLATPLCSG